MSLRRKLRRRTAFVQDHEAGASAEVDTLVLAQEAVRAGLINKNVLDHLNSLHPDVPKSMKHRYLLSHLYSTINNDQQLFIRMIRVFAKFQAYPMNATNVTGASKPREDISFGNEHIPNLAEILVQYAFQWRYIGTALRFKPQDLDNIQACQYAVSDLPKSCLIRLLEDWILKKHKHTLPPTLNSLEDVLNSHIVGLGAVASTVRTHFLFTPNSGSADKHQALSYFVTSLGITKSLGGKQFKCIHSKNVERIEAEEKGSVLLETQIASEDTLALSYQWLVNGMPLSEDAVHTGTRTPILCISNADIDMGGSKYSCKLTFINDGQTFTSNDVTLIVRCPLDQYMFSLASMYSAQPEVPKDTWPPTTCKRYINLTLIRQDRINYGAGCAYLTIHGGMDETLHQKERIVYEKVFESLRSGHVLFLEGRPGSGKTTFVHKFTQDWASTSAKAIKLLLLVSLRVLNSLNVASLDLLDILNLFKDLKINKQLIEERNGKGVCFIFDGLDEFSPLDGEESVVYKIITKQYLNQCTVIVASRPAAISELRVRANKVVEVVGFHKEQILEYFEGYPFSSSSGTKYLNVYLSSHPNILHMCYLPIHAAMVAFLFEVTGEVPKTETEIYTHFTRFTLIRTLTRNRAVNIDDIDVCCLSGREKILFTQICQLALEKTIAKKQFLRQDEIKSNFESSRGSDMSLGLITVDRTAGLYGFKDVYTFLHLTFQEYLAAYHISTLSIEEQQSLILETGDKSHMLVVWKFYCGLVEFNLKNSNFKSIIEKTPDKLLFHTHCAYESQQSLTCSQLLKSTKYFLGFICTYLTIPDFNAIGYVMNKSVLPTQLSIVNCDMKFSIEAMEGLLLLLSANLKELDLSDNDLGDVGARILASGLTSCNKLESLAIRNNHMSTEGVMKIFTSIKRCNLKLNSEDVTAGNDMTHGEFARVLQQCTNLQSLIISIRSDEPLSLCKNWKSLKELKVYLLPSWKGTAVSISHANTIAYSLQMDFSELRTLLLSNSSLPDEAAENLAEGLSRCPDLQVLDVSNSRHLDITGLGAIFASLMNCTNLKELHLNACSITCQGARILSLYLKHYRNLDTLSLNTNYIREAGAEALADNLYYCTQLNTLKFRYNRIAENRVRIIIPYSKFKGELEYLSSAE